MLVEPVHIYFKNIGLFFLEEPHPTVPSVKMADTLASYISNYKFRFKFNLKLITVNFNKKS